VAQARGTPDSVWPVAAGPAGRALAIVPAFDCPRCGVSRVADRDPSGLWTLQPIRPLGLFPQLAAWGPGGTATVIALANRAQGGGADAFMSRRAAGAESFDVGVPIGFGGPVYDNPRIASDSGGDIAIVAAVKGPDSTVRIGLVAARRGGSFGAPQELGAGYPEGWAVAVGGGRVVVAYPRGRRVYARSGSVGSPLAAPQLLGSHGPGELSAAIDDAGTATVAFARGRTLVAARARSGERFGAVAVIGRFRTESALISRAAAAGTTTALIWQQPFADHDVSLHAAIVRGVGRFGSPETPSAPGLGPRGSRRGPVHPVVTVGRAGDVLLAYAYSYGGAVHATMRPRRSGRFGPLHLISKLGEGGAPSVALLSDRRPLVVYHGRRGELLAATRLTGPRPDLTPPRLRVRFSADAADELRARNAVTVTVRCSPACMVTTHATLRTRDGRTTTSGVDRKIVRDGATFTERFEFDPDKRAGRARFGGRVRVTVNAQNASGASRETVRQIELP